MKDFTGMVRSYTHLSRAWYAETALAGRDYEDEVMFGLNAPEGGTMGEMAVRWSMQWERIGHPKDPVPQLQVFDDAWAALATFGDVLATFGDVLAKMAEVDGESISPERFCQILESCGFRDETATQPYYARKSEQPTNGAN